jgi:Bacterial Ig-like domain (group 3)
MGELRLPCDTSRNARASRMDRVWAGFKHERRGPRARRKPCEVRFESLEGRLLLSTFTVLNADDSGTGSLRQAILDANGATGMNTIAFNIPGTGVHTIAPLSALPTVTAPVIIDGYTQPDAHPDTLPPGEVPDAVLSIELSGVLAGTGVNGLEIAGGNSTVRGLVIDGFTTTNSVGGNGISLTTQGGDLIEGDYIGTDPTGAIAESNFQGVSVFSGTGDTIGGTTAGSRNVISGNVFYGVGVFNLADEATLITGNFIGTDARGTSPLGNSNTGVVLGGGLVTLGGTIGGAGNVISGNGDDGVFGFTRGLIEGNLIGTDASGFGKLGNGGDGIDLNGSNNMVGGTNALALNVISGNAGSGVMILNGSDNLIEGNHIGSGAPSTEPINLGNGGDGVTIFSVYPEDQGADNNTIGGTADGAGNEIAFNGGNGVTIANSGMPVTFSPIGDTILGDSVFSNAKLGIDLGNDGPTPNTPGGPHTGPNDLQNYPVITSAVSENETVTLGGTFNSIPDTTFLLQFFGNVRELTPGIFGGQYVLGSAPVTTDSLGNATFSANIFDFGGSYSATATDPNGNTSEFSAAFSSADLTPTTTALTSSATNADLGQPVTFTAVVSSSASGTPTGTVTFTIDGQPQTPVDVAVVGNEDDASLPPITNLSVGAHSITATYNGDSTFAVSSTMPLTQTVASIATITSIASSANAATVGQDVTFTATVDADSGTPTGTITFAVDGVAQTPGALALINGQDVATLTLATLGSGDHIVTAVYGGDASFAASSSDPVDVSINNVALQPTATTLTASPSRAEVGQLVTFTANVGPKDSSAGPSTLDNDSVRFTIDGGASTSVSLRRVDGQDVAILTTSMLAPGAHAVTASFDGDGMFAASVASTMTVTVEAASPALPAAVASPDGPLVMNFQRFGYHAQPTVLVLTFNKDLDPATADNAANYRIVPLGLHGKFGRAIAIKRIAYNPSARTVTLRPSQRLNVHDRFELLVNGTSTHAVADLALHALDGGKTGEAGSDYTGMIDWATLAGPSLTGKKYAEFWMNVQRRPPGPVHATPRSARRANS